MEIILSEQKQLLEEAERMANLGSWEFNLKDRILKWSDHHYTIFELEKSEETDLIAEFRKRVHPDDLPRITRIFHKMLLQEEPAELEFRLLMPDGRIKYILEKKDLIRDLNHEVIGGRGTIQDITLLKKQQEQLEFQASILNQIGEAVIATTPEGMIKYLNPSAEKMYDLKEEEVLGKNIRETLKTSIPYEAGGERMARISNGESSFSEFLVFRPDGSRIVAQAFTTAFYDKTGTVMGLVGISSDVTERETIWKQFGNMEMKFRSYAEFSSDVILTADKSGRLDYMSPRFRTSLGLNPEEYNQTSFLMLFHPEDQFLIRREIEKLETREIEMTRINCRVKMGEKLYRRNFVQISALFDLNERLSSFLIVIPDAKPWRSLKAKSNPVKDSGSDIE